MRRLALALATLLVFAPLAEAAWGDRRAARERAEAFAERAFPHEGRERWYRIFAPESLRSGAPAVLYLHGGTLSMRKSFRTTRSIAWSWVDRADENSFLLIVPNGTNPKNQDPKGDRQNWNDLRGPAAENATNVDDVGFLAALVEALSAEFALDRRRIYVTGPSNGGMMTYRMLAERPDLFAAGAAVVANLPARVADVADRAAGPRPIMILNGTDDPLMPYGGGGVTGGRGGQVLSTADTAAWWARSNGVSATPAAPVFLPDHDDADDCRISRQVYGEGGPAPVRLYTMHGGGHIAPSITYRMRDSRFMRRLIGNQCHDAEGTRLIWSFFRDHSL